MSAPKTAAVGGGEMGGPSTWSGYDPAHPIAYSALEDPALYDAYLWRLNEKSAFAKTLVAAEAALPDADVDKRRLSSMDVHRSAVHVSGQGLSEAERARIRERYSEKAKERRLRMYEKAILLAEEREREEGRRNRSRRYLYFKVPYCTYVGQEILLVGSSLSLGSWEIQKAIPLTWSPGHLWNGPATVSIDDGVIEYKFIARDSGLGHIIWEPGSNHKIDATKLAAGTTTGIDCFWGGGGNTP